MKYAKIILFTLSIMMLASCSTALRDPAQKDCNPDGITNSGTHFQDYERCSDL